MYNAKYVNLFKQSDNYASNVIIGNSNLRLKRFELNQKRYIKCCYYFKLYQLCLEVDKSLDINE